MSYQHPAQTQRPMDNHRGLRLLALTAVVVGLMLLAAAAFVLSYAGIHEVALSAGVSPRWARLYPLIFDAMLVIAGAAVLSLRGAGVLSRCYAWLTMLALFAAAAGADTVHAMHITLPSRPTAAAAATIPWALVLIGFGLLLCMLRQARLRRAAAAAMPERVFPERPGHVEVRVGSHEVRAEGSDKASAAAAPMVSASPGAAAVSAPVSRVPRPALPSTSPAAATPSPGAADPGPDDPASDEGSSWFPGPGGERAADHGVEPDAPRAGDRAESAFSPAPTMPVDADTDGSTPDQEPDADHDTFLDLVETIGPGGGRISQFPPHPRVAPEATFEAQPEAAPDLGPEPGATSQPQPGPQPTPEAALRADPETIPQPGSGDAGEEVAAQPQTGTGHEGEVATQPLPGTGQEREVAAQPQTGTEQEPEAAAEAQTGTEQEPEAAAQAEPQPQPEAEPQTGPQPDAEAAAQPQPGPSPDSQPSPPPDPRPTPDAQPTKHTPPQPRPAPESGASPRSTPPPAQAQTPNTEGDLSAEPEPGPDATARSAPTSAADPTPEPGVATPPAPAQFDRMRSSPVPPEA
jgi:uncharacterized membrane protein SirB2